MLSSAQVQRLQAALAEIGGFLSSSFLESASNLHIEYGDGSKCYSSKFWDPVERVADKGECRSPIADIYTDLEWWSNRRNLPVALSDAAGKDLQLLNEFQLVRIHTTSLIARALLELGILKCVPRPFFYLDERINALQQRCAPSDPVKLGWDGDIGPSVITSSAYPNLCKELIPARLLGKEYIANSTRKELAVHLPCVKFSLPEDLDILLKNPPNPTLVQHIGWYINCLGLIGEPFLLSGSFSLAYACLGAIPTGSSCPPIDPSWGYASAEENRIKVLALQKIILEGNDLSF